MNAKIKGCGVYNHDWQKKDLNRDECKKCGLLRAHLDKNRTIQERTKQYREIVDPKKTHNALEE